MTEIRDPASSSWHLDRRLPIALIVTLAIQTGGAVWWASSIASAMTNASLAQTALSIRVEKLETSRDDISSRLVRVETQIGNVSDQVKEQRDILLQILQELRNKSPSP